MTGKSTARQFNPLERALLDWFASHHGAPELAAQLAGARVLRREYSVVGYHIWLNLAPDAEPIPPAARKSPMSGPGIASKDIDEGGSTQLWINEEGFVDCLEMRSNGGHFAETITQFELLEPVAQ